MVNKSSVILLAAFLSSGCSITSVQCGVDGDSSYVNYQSNFPTQTQTRHLGALCAFVYTENSDAE